VPILNVKTTGETHILIFSVFGTIEIPQILLLGGLDAGRMWGVSCDPLTKGMGTACGVPWVGRWPWPLREWVLPIPTPPEGAHCYIGLSTGMADGMKLHWVRGGG
jgi:hypothetical protein